MLGVDDADDDAVVADVDAAAAVEAENLVNGINAGKKKEEKKASFNFNDKL